MVSPTPPSAGTERAFGRGLTRIFAPGELFMMSHGAGNFMRASLLECPRGWGFENRNLQIPTFAPSVPALGGRDWSGKTIDRCINYSSRGQNSLCTWENLLTLPCHQYIRGLPRSINSFNMASIYTCTCTCRSFVDTCNCNFIAFHRHPQS